MIKILILTDEREKWAEYLSSIIRFDHMRKNINQIILLNPLLCFHIQSSFPESKRGAAFAHVIVDKEIDVEDFYNWILPTIKQRVTQYGSRTILGEQ